MAPFTVAAVSTAVVATWVATQVAAEVTAAATGSAARYCPMQSGWLGVALIFAALAANTAENQTLSAQPPGMSVIEQKSPVAST